MPKLPGRKDGGLTERDKEILRQVVAGEIWDRPPTIGVVGVSGVGKSSTINALFRSELETSDTVACTKSFWTLDVELELTDERLEALASPVRTRLAGARAPLHVIDAPGLGEDRARDPEYLDQYRDHLAECDVILWIMAARNRAVALDQQYLSQLGEFHDQMVFGINQVDLVEPRDWHPVLNGPSDAQTSNIAEITQDRRRRIESVLKRKITMVPYSATVRHDLQHLFTALVARCPPHRAWIFSLLKGFRHDDFLATDIRKHLAAIAQSNDAADAA